MSDGEKLGREGNVQKNPLDPDDEQPERETPSSGPEDTDRPGVSVRREDVKKVSRPQDEDLSDEEAREAGPGEETPEAHRPGRMGEPG
jgi:hypothetical protein